MKLFCANCGKEFDRSPSLAARAKEHYCSKACAGEGQRTYDIEEIFDYVVKYKVANDGLSPSVREVVAEFGMSSTSVGMHYLKLLEKAGRIVRGKRGVKVVGGAWTLGDQD
jgi:hypothetical protein